MESASMCYLHCTAVDRHLQNPGSCLLGTRDMPPTPICLDNHTDWLFSLGSCRCLVLMGRMMQTNLKWNSQKVYLSCTRENSVKHLLQLDQEITKEDVCIL